MSVIVHVSKEMIGNRIKIITMLISNKTYQTALILYLYRIFVEKYQLIRSYMDKGEYFAVIKIPHNRTAMELKEIIDKHG